MKTLQFGLGLFIVCFLVASSEASWLRVLNGLHQSETMDVWINGARFYNDLEYTQMPPHFWIPEGQHTIWFSVKASEGFGEESDEPIILSADTELEVNKTYTLAITGSLDTQNIEAELYTDERESTLFSGMFGTQPNRKFLRLGHLAQGVDNIDLYINGQLFISGTEFMGASDYIRVPDSIDLSLYNNIQVRFGDSVVQVSGMTMRNSFKLSELYTVWLFGTEESGFEAILHEDYPIKEKNSRVRFIHSHADSGIVDIFMDKELIFESVSFANVTDYVDTYRGVHHIIAVPTGLVEEAFFEEGNDLSDLGLTNAVDYWTFTTWEASYSFAIIEPTAENQSLEIYGEEPAEVILSEISNVTRVWLFRDALTTEVMEDRAAVRFIHLAPDVDELQLVLSNAERLILSAEYLSSTRWREIKAGDYSLKVNITVDNEFFSGFEAEGDDQIAGLYAIEPDRPVVETEEAGAQAELELHSAEATVIIMDLPLEAYTLSLESEFEEGYLYTIWCMQGTNRNVNVFVTRDIKAEDAQILPIGADLEDEEWVIELTVL